MPLPTLGLVSVFNFSHYSRCVLLWHCGFNLHFLTTPYAFNSFFCLHFIELFTFLFLNCMCSLYTLDKSSLSDTHFEIFFFPVHLASHFVFVTVLSKSKHFYFDEIQFLDFFLLYFMFFCVPCLKNLFQTQSHYDFFFLDVLKFQLLQLRYVIHFALILYMMWERTEVRLLAVAVQLFLHHLLKWLSLLCLITSAPLPKINCPHTCGSKSGLNILLHWSVFNLLSIPHCLDYCNMIVSP